MKTLELIKTSWLYTKKNALVIFFVFIIFVFIAMNICLLYKHRLTMYFFMHGIQVIANLFAMIGVLFAYYTYKNWSKKYYRTKINDSALGVLTQTKLLHHALDELRARKMYSPDRLDKDLDEKYIPLIHEKIFKKTISIREEVVALDIIVGDDALLQHFNRLIVEGVIKKINLAIIEFYQNYQSKQNLSVKDSQLFRIIFPFEQRLISHNDIKASEIGIVQEIVNDSFNKEIEKNFNDIYKLLNAKLSLN